MSQEVMSLPFVSINGCLLTRSGMQPIDHFNADVSDSFPFPRPVFVPIDLPVYYARAVKSAAWRALGPMTDAQEKSGVVFTLRSIGVRAVGEVEEDEGMDAEAMEEAMEVDAGEDQGDLGEMPLEALNAKQLKKHFGRAALDMVGAMFQHQSKIGESARFMTRSCWLLEVNEVEPHGFASWCSVELFAHWEAGHGPLLLCGAN